MAITDAGDEIGIRSQQQVVNGLTLERGARSMSLCIGATCGWHRDIMQIFSNIMETDTYDDLVFYFRAMLAGDRIGYVPEPLIYYRVGSGITNTPVKTYPEKIASLERNASIQLGTLKQRLRDCESYTSGLHHIKRYLKFKIKVSRGLKQAYRGESYISVIKTLSPIIVLGYMYGKRQLKRADQWPLI